MSGHFNIKVRKYDAAGKSEWWDAMPHLQNYLHKILKAEKRLCIPNDDNGYVTQYTFFRCASHVVLVMPSSEISLESLQ